MLTEKQLKDTMKRLVNLDHDDRVAIRDVLNVQLREEAFQRLDHFFKEKNAPVDDPYWKEWHELKFLLGSATQTLEEGDAVIHFIEFARSATTQALVEFTDCGLLFSEVFEGFREAALGGGKVSSETINKLVKFNGKFCRATAKACEMNQVLQASPPQWKDLRGYSQEEHAKLMKRLDELNIKYPQP